MNAYIIDFEGEWRDGVAVVVAKDGPEAVKAFRKEIIENHQWIVDKCARQRRTDFINHMERLDLNKPSVKLLYMGYD